MNFSYYLVGQLSWPDSRLTYRSDCLVETGPSSKSVKPPVSGTMDNFTIILIAVAVALFAWRLINYVRVKARLANSPPTPSSLEVGPANPTWPRYETPFGAPGAEFGAPGDEFGASGTTLQGLYKATELPTYEQAMTIKDTKSHNVYESGNVYGVV